MRLLRDKSIELQIVESLSHITIERLKKTQLKPHLKKMWFIPSKQNAEFVAHMEDVLKVYSKPFNPICNVKYDSEYIRNGSYSIFMFTEPLGCWREAHALSRRTADDWANQMKWLIDE